MRDMGNTTLIISFYILPLIGSFLSDLQILNSIIIGILLSLSIVVYDYLFITREEYNIEGEEYKVEKRIHTIKGIFAYVRRNSLGIFTLFILTATLSSMGAMVASGNVNYRVIIGYFLFFPFIIVTTMVLMDNLMEETTNLFIIDEREIKIIVNGNRYLFYLSNIKSIDEEDNRIIIKSETDSISIWAEKTDEIMKSIVAKKI